MSSSNLVITVNLSHYLNNHKCPLCDVNTESGLDQVDEKTRLSYLQYVETAKQHFKEMSLPLCPDCWRRMCNWCTLCGFPISETKRVANEILSKTTFRNVDNLCDCEGYVCEKCSQPSTKDL